MKRITYFIIAFVLFISCQTKKEINLESYKSGIEVLEKVDSNGNTDYSMALELFAKSEKTNSKHVETKYWKSLCEIKLGQLDNALKTSQTVFNDSGNDGHILIPQFYTTAGLVEKINGNIESSTLYFEKATNIYDLRIKKSINDIDAIMNYAIVLCYMDKKDSAILFLNSISLNEEKQTELEQIRESISLFDADEIIAKIKETNE